jgi:geranylgeranyl diphosphate synthase type I
VHKLAEAYHQEHSLRGDLKHFGTSVAITFGLAICAKACEIWSDAEVAKIALPKARKIFDHMHYDVSWGQYLDIMIPAQTKIPTKEMIIQIMEEKTSKYTIKNPLQSGAVQGGVAHENIAWLAEFGKQLGIAYQIADDILGVYGKPSMTGKSIDSDIREGKATFLVWLALDSAISFDRQVILNFYTGNNRNDKAVVAIKNIFDKYNVRIKAEDDAKEYINRALEIIHTAPINNLAKQELEIFSKFIIERNK